MSKRYTRCVHFTGIQNDCCKVGLNYRAVVGGDNAGWAARLPCVPDSPLRKDAATCDKFCAPTPEELAKEDAEDKAAWARMRVVLAGISEWRKKPPRGKQEVVECPACKGRLHLSQSRINGHIHGHCETEGCVRWME